MKNETKVFVDEEENMEKLMQEMEVRKWTRVKKSVSFQYHYITAKIFKLA